MPELVSKKDRMQTVRDMLKEYQPQLTAALPIQRKKDAERLARLLLTEIARTPRLLECTPQSLMGALLQAAAFGLDPGIMGDCWLIPRRNRHKDGAWECGFQLGYKGLLKLCRRSGEIGPIQARVVREKDDFAYEFGLKPNLTHRPSGSEDAGEIRYVYAVVQLKDGTAMFDVWTKGQIDAHRKRYSQSPDEGPWQSAWDEMAKKTVLLRVCKLAPASIELQTAIALDELVDADEPQNLGALVEPTTTDTRLDKLTKELRARDAATKKAGDASADASARARAESTAVPPQQGGDRPSPVAPAASPIAEPIPAKERSSDAPPAQPSPGPPTSAAGASPVSVTRGAGGTPAPSELAGIMDASKVADRLTKLRDTLGMSGAKGNREYLFLWQRYIGQGVSIDHADPAKLQELVAVLEKFAAQRKKR